MGFFFVYLEYKYMWYRHSMIKRVSLVVLFDGDKVLLGKKSSGYWIPGGHAQGNESSLDAAIREFKEETNLDISNLKLFHSKISDEKIVDFYVCNSYVGDAKADDDLEEVHWFSINELPEMRLDGNSLVMMGYDKL